MRNSLQKLYDKMWEKDTEEVVVENTNTFSKFDLDDYTEIVYEGKRGHGDTTSVKELMNIGVELGLIRVKPTTDGYMIYSNKDRSLLSIHRGETGLHELRRFLKKLGYDHP